METPETKDAKTPLKPDKIDEFTAQLVALEAFFMSEVFELKNEKEASLNVGNSFFEENLDTENLKYQISLLQRENTFIKTELNNKQHIIEKLLNINNNQSNVNDINITDMHMSIKIIASLKIIVKIKETPQKMLNIKTEVENQT